MPARAAEGRLYAVRMLSLHGRDATATSKALFSLSLLLFYSCTSPSLIVPSELAGPKTVASPCAEFGVAVVEHPQALFHSAHRLLATFPNVMAAFPVLSSDDEERIPSEQLFGVSESAISHGAGLNEN
eukprot:6207379-Pleurochrysis_carterae.AAC.1